MVFNSWILIFSLFALIKIEKIRYWSPSRITPLFLLLVFLIIIFVFINVKKIILFINNPTTYKPLITSLLIILTLFFSSDRLILFYFFYEASLIPVVFLIAAWGSQIERFLASLIMLIYMVIASFPLLVLILRLHHAESSISISLLTFKTLINPYCSKIQMLLIIIAISTFLVKFPIFTFHLWLPKAHVEAPFCGSIILAGILLKIAGYGIIIIKSLCNMAPLITIIASFTIGGGAIAALFCLYQTDIKVLIAYFSVSHIRICIRRLLLFRNERMEGILVILLAHGFCSAGLFLCAFLFYIDSNRRNILLNKGYLNKTPSLTKLFFIILIANIATPPTANFFGEVKTFTGLIAINRLFMPPFFLIIFFSVVCSILFFSFTQNIKPLTWNLINSPQQIISSFSLLTFRVIIYLLALLTSKLLYLILTFKLLT